MQDRTEKQVRRVKQRSGFHSVAKKKVANQIQVLGYFVRVLLPRGQIQEINGFIRLMVVILCDSSSLASEDV